MKIGETRIGVDEPPFFIAEAGVNHNGEVEMAMELVEKAAAAGADAVKFQTFDTERLVTDDAPKAKYQAEETGDKSQKELLEQYELDSAVYEQLYEKSTEEGIMFLSTPFDPESADLISELGAPAIKLGSGDLDNHPLLKHVAELGKPMIVSTGMGTLEEVRAARGAIRSVAPGRDIAFLHCTSAYPCDVADVNLRAMQTMESAFPEPIGYSDHTTLVKMPGYAVAAGAQIVEKHFTLDSTLPGPDHSASLEPDELARAVDAMETAGMARGKPIKQPTRAERVNRHVARKSLHAARDLCAGTELTREHIRIVRPGDGLSPRYLTAVLGETLTEEVIKDKPITADKIGREFS